MINNSTVKLLYITNQVCGSGGLERVLSIKASYLADRFNYEVHIITLNQGDTPLFYNFSKSIIYHDITATGNPVSYFLKYRKGLKKIINSINPNIISVCDDGLKGFFVPTIIKKTCPMVYERHVSKNIEIKSDNPSPLLHLKSKLIFALMDFGAKKYDKFIVLTKGNLKEWNLNNLMVIPNPLSFYPTNVSTLKNKIVIAVGKHCYQKGFDRLLKSWKIVNSRYSDWVLNIYGTISKKEGLDQLAKSLKINKSVNFFPPVKNIAEKYEEASIYVMSSRYEGFGMVLTEAMAHGVPCVSYDCPYGPSDIINHEENGILVKEGDINGLAEGITKLVSNLELRELMGANARKHVKHYLPEVIVEKWHNLFCNLISKA